MAYYNVYDSDGVCIWRGQAAEKNEAKSRARYELRRRLFENAERRGKNLRVEEQT
ncbi:hypothetical protein [Pyramidobacter piscolens]|uniref:hypothetical protein n=1 Tax=Pyramidobacter piscolens TaxID=638849 RepID=UPI002AB024BF|nr:hypothetical protein [Pyramidobacter piscolens]